MQFDIVMPLTLFLVTLVSLFLNQKTEDKLKSRLEGEFGVRDVLLLVAAMVGMIVIIAFVRDIASPLLILFLFSYSTLLFTFGYVFSKNRWYVAVIAPIVFLTLFFFLRGTDIWKLYLVNIYGLIFAVLIVLYLAGLFTWKSVFYFAGIMTALDIILVLVTGTMVQAAQTTQKLELPVMVSLPIFPVLMERYVGGFMSLGLGDFFFAGLLAVHTFKKYGRKLALVSIVAMTVSFFVFLATLLSLDPMPFPGTLMIICGWAVIVLPIEIRRRKPPQPAQNTNN
jgi:hypothetical protein